MECFYQDQSGRDVVLDTSKLDLGHTTIETSLEFDENWNKKQAKDVIKKTVTLQLDAADSQSRLIAETVRASTYRVSLPRRKREYIPYNEDNRNTPPLREVERTAIPYNESSPLRTPDQLAEAIETGEGFVKGVDDLGKPVILRKTAYEALKITKSIAHKKGYKLSVTSSYRSFAWQAARVAQRKAEGKYNPAYLAPAGRSNHHSGGAVDIHAIDSRGRENQKALAEIMTEAGFVNYKLEDWHWEYGTLRWAKAKGQNLTYAKVANLDMGSVPSAQA